MPEQDTLHIVLENILKKVPDKQLDVEKLVDIINNKDLYKNKKGENISAYNIVCRTSKDTYKNKFQITIKLIDEFEKS